MDDMRGRDGAVPCFRSEDEVFIPEHKQEEVLVKLSTLKHYPYTCQVSESYA